MHSECKLKTTPGKPTEDYLPRAIRGMGASPSGHAESCELTTEDCYKASIPCCGMIAN